MLRAEGRQGQLERSKSGSTTRNRHNEAVTTGDMEERARLSTASDHAGPEGVDGTDAKAPHGKVTDDDHRGTVGVGFVRSR
jgi:hypothetical protein